MNLRLPNTTRRKDGLVLYDPNHPHREQSGGGVNRFCSFINEANVLVKFGKRTYCFDFSERFGPLFLDIHGEPLRNQPQPRTKAWQAFKIWHGGYKQRNRAMTTTTESDKG